MGPPSKGVRPGEVRVIGGNRLFVKEFCDLEAVRTGSRLDTLLLSLRHGTCVAASALHSVG
jgi:hypothetical protein